jgi:hypothetical protein
VCGGFVEGHPVDGKTILANKSAFEAMHGQSVRAEHCLVFQQVSHF